MNSKMKLYTYSDTGSFFCIFVHKKGCTDTLNFPIDYLNVMPVFFNRLKKKLKVSGIKVLGTSNLYNESCEIFLDGYFTNAQHN